MLLKNGANPNIATNTGGVTPLHRAAYSGHNDIVLLLLQYKANPTFSDADGKIALHKVNGLHIFCACWYL